MNKKLFCKLYVGKKILKYGLLLCILACGACQNNYQFEAEAQTLEKTPTLLDTQFAQSQKIKDQLQGGTLEEPVFIVDPYNIAPCSAIMEFTTEDCVAVDMIVKGRSAMADLHYHFEPDNEHILPIIGLLAEGQTTVELQIGDQKYRYELSAGPLPENTYFPEVTQANLIDNQNNLYFTSPSSNGHVSGYDCNGDLRFILSSMHFWDVNVLSTGELILSSDRILNGPYYTTGFVLMDLMGHVKKEYTLPGGYHHDVDELPNGNFLVCSDDFNGNTVEDIIVEVDYKTGEIVKRFDLKNIFDTLDGHSLNWTASDWFHCNAVDYNEINNTLTVSGRHLDVVAVIDYDSGALKYLIGPNEGWSEEMQPYFLDVVNEENFEWQWAQHAATWIDANHLMLFDNGMNRSKKTANVLPAKDNYSRMVIYEIDEAKHTIEQVYQYGKERGYQYYSPYISDCDFIGDNHYLIDSGGISYLNGAINNAPGPQTPFDEMNAFISEVKDDKLVFEMKLPCNIYRAEKINVDKFKCDLFVEGQRLGNLGETKIGETTTINKLLDKYKDLEINDEQPIQITNEGDRLVTYGTLHREDNLELVLVQDKHAYLYPLQVDEDPGVCVAIFNSPKPDESLMIQTISSYGLKGEYRICYIFNGKLYDTTYVVEY